MKDCPVCYHEIGASKQCCEVCGYELVEITTNDTDWEDFGQHNLTVPTGVVPKIII